MKITYGSVEHYQSVSAFLNEPIGCDTDVIHTEGTDFVQSSHIVNKVMFSQGSSH